MRKFIAGLMLLAVSSCTPAFATSDISNKITFCVATGEVVTAAEEAKRAGLSVDDALSAVAEAVVQTNVDHKLGAFFMHLTASVYAGTQSTERYMDQCLRWAVK